MKFFNLVAEFTMYPKTEDVTLDFFNFLEHRCPIVWKNLNKFYADDCDGGTEFDWNNPPSNKFDEYRPNPRMARYGWDDLLAPENFGEFLQSLKSIWLFLTEKDFGVCEICNQIEDLEYEHDIIVSYGFGPVVKFYEHFEMDGSRFKETLCCRKCAHELYTNLVDKMNAERVTCVV